MAPQTRAQVQQGQDETSTSQGADSNPSNGALDRIEEMLRSMVIRMDNLERRVVEGEVERPYDNRQQEPLPREQRVERRNAQLRDGVEDGKLKHDIPEFHGRANPEEFLEWMDQVDLIFQLHNYSEEYQVKLIVAAFRGHALTWWKDLIRRRARGGELAIASWNNLRNVMKAAFVPKSHTTFLRKELQNLKQERKSVAEYYYEMKRLITRLELEEEEEETEVRFVEGLNMQLRHKVELESFRTTSLEELFKYAVTIEQQLKEEALYRGKFKYPAPVAKPTSATARPYPTTPGSSKTAENRRPTPPAPTDHSRPGARPAAPTVPSRPAPQAPATRIPAPTRMATRQTQCFKCKGMGHYANECPNQRVMILGEDGSWYSEDEDEGGIQEDCPDTYIGFSSEEEPEGTHATSYERSLVIMRSLSIQHKEDEHEEQRANIFHMQCKVKEKTCLTIVDGGSCTNAVSQHLVDKLSLSTHKHPAPYKLRWLGDYGEIRVAQQCIVPISVGTYFDEVTCDVVPMDACHILLGRPWEYDSYAIHDGRTNEYVLNNKGKRIRLKPLPPHIVHKAHVKIKDEKEREKRQIGEKQKPKEYTGRGKNKMVSEKPQVGEIEKGNLFTSKGEIGRVMHDQTQLVLLLHQDFCLSVANTNRELPSVVSSVLQKFEDVFPEEMPHGLPPIRGI